MFALVPPGANTPLYSTSLTASGSPAATRTFCSFSDALTFDHICETVKTALYLPGKGLYFATATRVLRFENSKNIFGSIVVTAKTGIPVKIVMVRNRSKKSECLYLLSTDCSLGDAEIVRIYGNRWSGECFFKASESFLKSGREFQSRTYDAMVSQTAIVFTRYTLLEWIRRNERDQNTYGSVCRAHSNTFSRYHNLCKK